VAGLSGGGPTFPVLPLNNLDWLQLEGEGLRLLALVELQEGELTYSGGPADVFSFLIQVRETDGLQVYEDFADAHSLRLGCLLHGVRNHAVSGILWNCGRNDFLSYFYG
jgi:hypothetical protein